MTFRTKWPAPRFSLGDEVVTRRKAIRHDRGYVPAGKPESAARWGFGWTNVELPNPITGIITGVRFVQEGFVTHYPGEGGVWHCRGTRQVYLITFNLLKAPLKVFPADVMSQDEFAKTLLLLPASTL